MSGDKSAQVEERILQLAAYFKQHAGATRDDVRRDVPLYRGMTTDASIRQQLYRDIETLRESLGIVVEWEELDQRYVMRPPFLTAAERKQVLAAAAAVDVDLEGIEEPEPGAIGGALDDADTQIFLTVSAAVRVLRDAIATRTPVTFNYSDQPRRLEPWVIALWRRHWYVVGREQASGERRVFRIDRASAVRGATDAAPGSFEIPADFARASAIALDPNDWGTDPPVTALIEVDPDYADRLAYSLGGRVRPARSGQPTLVEAQVRNYAAFVDRVLEVREHARVVEPTALVDAVVGWLTAVTGSSA